MRALRQENLAARHGGFARDTIVEGSSPAWQKLSAQIAHVASSNAPVLVEGETGSGKEVVARLLHALSRRADGPFIAVNSGAVSRELLESELFGYEKGAFTGAGAAKAGLIAASEGGTLFLDEVGEMPGPMQVSLLRFLDRSEYRPVGSTRTLQADVRIVGATNQDLQELVLRGRFRDDLLYRINTITLRVPPLRERKKICRIWLSISCKPCAFREQDTPLCHRTRWSSSRPMAGRGMSGNSAMSSNGWC